MNVAEYIVKRLEAEKIEHVFGYQGGNITYMIDAISNSANMTYIQTYNEQGAAFAANAYAQVSEKFGVAISSSGPGAINLLNGIANAYYDSIPCLFICGNINTASMRDSDNLRQNGFQETDIVSIAKSITKYSITVYNANELPKILDKAIKIMKQGRPGPVLLDIPHNIQRSIIEYEGREAQERENYDNDTYDFLTITALLEEAERPVLLLGNGARSSKSRKFINALLDLCPMPVVSSLCGKDVIDNNHSCYRGMIGSYGLSHTNRTLNNADFVLVLGSRMDERQRTVVLTDFLKNTTVIHVDIDFNELGHVVPHEKKIKMRTEDFLERMITYVNPQNKIGWLNETAKWQEDVDDKEWILGKKTRDCLVHILGEKIEDTVICVDVGNHQMAAAQALKIGKESKYLNSAGLGSMGYALPAAIGAYYAAPSKRIVCIVGDGGIMMNLQELQLIERERIPIKIVIVNNQVLGMIENYQKIAFDGRLYGSRWGYKSAEFEKIAKAFNLEYVKADIEYTISKLQLPAIIEIEVEQ